MKKLAITALCLLLSPAAYAQSASTLVADVRSAMVANDFGKAEKLVREARRAGGITPLVLEAQSWLGRGALAAKQYDRAERFAQETFDLAVAEAKRRPVDAEPRLPIALGAAIEVLAHAGAARGARTDAIVFLEDQLRTYRDTSMHKRIQKNINLLSLEGTVAPALDLSEHLGGPPVPLASLKGQVVLLFFWAHWCPDCKSQVPTLARLLDAYGSQGLTMVAPTQRFGFVAGGREAPAAAETKYIGEVLQAAYRPIARFAVPLGETNHRRYGVSTTPTLVVVDRDGIIRLYRPGTMPFAELDPLIRRLVAGASADTVRD